MYLNNIMHYVYILKSISFPGFEIKELPKPDSLEAVDIPPKEYHRIAVSYGLSFSEIDIGRILRPKDNEDISLDFQQREWRNSMYSGCDFYPFRHEGKKICCNP